MKKLLYVFTFLFILAGCSQEAPAPSPTPEPSPEPTPITEYILSTESADEILALAELDSLKFIDARSSSEYEALTELQGLLPECEIVWQYEFQGSTYDNNTTELTATDLTGLEEAIRALPKLNYIDLLDSPATVEDLDRYSAINPDIFFLWSFKHDGFKIRTDIQVYSSLRGNDMRRFTDADMYPMLKYCKKLKALDLGHCNLEDMSLIGELTELEVLILGENPYITDASPLGNLENLEYLELFLCQDIEDTTFLNKLTNMVDLNVSYVSLTNLDFLGSMPNIKLFHCKYCNINEEEYNYWLEQYPEALFVTTNGDIHSCDNIWRGTDRNYQIRYMFSNWRHVMEYRHYNDVDYDLEKHFY